MSSRAKKYEEIVECEEKEFVNTVLIGKYLSQQKDNGGVIIVLDHYWFRTTVALIQNGFSAERIYVIERNEQTHQKMLDVASLSPALNLVHFVKGDLFHLLPRFAARRNVFAVVGDLMQSHIGAENRAILADFVDHSDVQHVFINLSARVGGSAAPAGSFANTVRGRIEALQTSDFGRKMGSLRLVYPYRRRGIDGRLCTMMVFLAFVREQNVATLYRPRSIVKLADDRFRVTNWCYRDCPKEENADYVQSIKYLTNGAQQQGQTVGKKRGHATEIVHSKKVKI